MPCFRQLMTQSGHQPNIESAHQSEALQSDPTNTCGGLNYRKANHVEKRDPRSDDNKR